MTRSVPSVLAGLVPALVLLSPSLISAQDRYTNPGLSVVASLGYDW